MTTRMPRGGWKRGNLPPNPVLQGNWKQEQLAKQADKFLRQHDQKRITLERIKAKKQAERDEKQVRENPQLIAERRRALRL